MAVTPVSLAIFTRFSASCTLSVTGISTSTCLPARITCSACLKCILVGVARITASARLIPSARSFPQWGMAYFLATCSVPAGSPPINDTTSTPEMRFSASRCFCPKAPCPATQIFILLLVVERAAHDEPHHQLYRLRAGFAQVLEMGNSDQRLRVLRQVVEEPSV